MPLGTFKSEIAKVGPAWTANPETWPGVGGKAGITNHYLQNVNPSLPDQKSTVGGKKKKRRTRRHVQKKKRLTKSKKRLTKSKRRMRGGKHHGSTLMPQPLVNLGRSIAYQGENLWNSFAGNPASVNPDPLVQPINH